MLPPKRRCVVNWTQEVRVCMGASGEGKGESLIVRGRVEGHICIIKSTVHYRMTSPRVQGTSSPREPPVPPKHGKQNEETKTTHRTSPRLRPFEKNYTRSRCAYKFTLLAVVPKEGGTFIPPPPAPLPRILAAPISSLAPPS